ncbi:MAG: hypothetical protein BMS9Abin29_1583 [Gemmatimonadota bacterium]|nr:MAG: hypothetical protein BMS9Abin29_1583 [Gemmatimonadota bacterium]
MIFRCNFEELSALRHGARAVLDEYSPEEAVVAAPPEDLEQVARVLPRLEGDLSIGTLREQRGLQKAVMAIVERLRVEMEVTVAATHPADEGAVTAYFDFAHAYSVLSRLDDIGLEMEALIELVTGASASDDIARTFVFPD